MPGAMPEHVWSMCSSDAKKCYERTQRTNATDVRIQDSGLHLAVLNAPTPVDNQYSVVFA